jgi:23S rRNA (adenine2503-C2)-methyltransferase
LLGVAPSAAGGLLGGSGRAKLVWEVLREGRDPFDEGSGLGQNTRAALHEHFSPPAHEMLATSVSECGTRKLLLRLPRGDEVETVIIPHRGFSTLCVSSQVGCRQGCTFCATGTMGLLRSLTADEILLQLHAASAAVREHGMPPLRNVVFMGMGEPADNVEHVAGALHAMTHPFGFQLGKKYVCVSTVGPSPAHIRALEPLPARLAWSVHAADDKLRQLLVPTTRHTMAELRDAWGEVLEARRDRGLMAEVTLIDGVNDGAEHAEELHALLAPLPGKTRINLIPYNANAGLGAAGRLFLPSPPEAVQAFHARLIDLGVICTVRVPRGNEEDSACGMLRVTKGGSGVD